MRRAKTAPVATADRGRKVLRDLRVLKVVRARMATPGPMDNKARKARSDWPDIPERTDRMVLRAMYVVLP